MDKIKNNIDILKFKYGIVTEDILFCRDDQVIFYTDMKNSNFTENSLIILNGDISKIGFEKRASFAIKNLFNHFDITSEVGEVSGHLKYKDQIINDIKNIKEHIKTKIPITKNGKKYWLNIVLKVVKYTSDNKPELLMGFISNDTNQEKHAEKIYSLAYKDQLTGLFNRNAFVNHINSINSKDKIFGMYIDLDNFKRVNDTFGHHTGDEVLKEFSNILLNLVDDDIIFYRLYGDEFFVQISTRDEEKVFKLANEIITRTKLISIKGVKITASIGVIEIFDKIFNVDMILKYSDSAMYTAKQTGKDKFIYFDKKKIANLLEVI